MAAFQTTNAGAGDSFWRSGQHGSSRYEARTGLSYSSDRASLRNVPRSMGRAFRRDHPRRQETVSPTAFAFGPSCRVAGKLCRNEGLLAPEDWGFFAERWWRWHRLLNRGSSAHWASANGRRHRQGLCEVAISTELRERGQGAIVLYAHKLKRNRQPGRGSAERRGFVLFLWGIPASNGI